MKSVEELTQQFRASGLKVTPQRQSIFRALSGSTFAIEVETSGTLAPPAGADRAIQWNVSLKLAGAGVDESKRLHPDAIRSFLSREAWWKFVVADEGDVSEVLGLVERFALPRGRILLQPEATRREELVERSPWVVEACKRHGFRFSPRLHVLLWGAKRGV